MATIYKDKNRGGGRYLVPGKYSFNDLKTTGHTYRSNNNNKSNITGYEVQDNNFIKFYYSEDNKGQFVTRPYTGHPDKYISVMSEYNDVFKSVTVCPFHPECFENKGSSYNLDYTNTYIFALLLIVSFFYICKK